ncbi:hypothetical protein OBP_253 [Pseudomonas phage OBP]|uniref:hypothetical protein n=1 Tax=Pseudomonas phage OBP TaxID=1124849 RepID=UPI000240D5E1|nr:hypothetical protein OBP_253 [Pseudomonas phage OBP]AEV89690.1 hypothetical protein OBP_253 [Pseudomonas phage OBP]
MNEDSKNETTKLAEDAADKSVAAQEAAKVVPAPAQEEAPAEAPVQQKKKK